VKRPACAVYVAGITIAAAISVAPAVGQQSASRTAPTDAANLKLLDSVCGACHTRSAIVGTHRTRRDWEEVLEWMLDEGATMSDDEFAQMLAFLSVRYGSVDVNAATADDIRSVLELTEAQASRLVAARTAGRRFVTTQDVADAAGVPASHIESRKARVELGR
jgi:hypothetical protein